MKIEHIAIWTNQLETMREFYKRYFKGLSNDKYINHSKGFESYFITFDDGARLELMQQDAKGPNPNTTEQQHLGLIHFAMSVGSETAVDQLTETLRQDGYPVIGEPRRTGDGYYESVVLDPDGNRIEITI